MDLQKASPAELASYGLALYVERGKEVSEVMDELLTPELDPQDMAAALDPFGDHPEATKAYTSGDTLGTPEGMNLQEAPLGVIP